MTTSLNALTPEMRRKLHRHCARMTGSTFDGEDVLQEAFLKAHDADLRDPREIGNPERWLFRIVHRSAMDFLRRRHRSPVLADDELVAAHDHGSDADDADRRWAVHVALRSFISLPSAQRAAVILVDVLGYSLEETAGITERSVPATKSALFRGRQRLRAADAKEASAQRPADEADLARLAKYADLFNARDFDALGRMLAEDTKLELVGGPVSNGRHHVERQYFGNYSRSSGWQARAAIVDGRPALVMSWEGREPYFVELRFRDRNVSEIRDFVHAHYGTSGSSITFV